VQIPRLREWREARALTQKELADKAGISWRSVAGYEAGAGARPGTVRSLAAALEIDTVDLLATPPKGWFPRELDVDEIMRGIMRDEKPGSPRALREALYAAYAREFRGWIEPLSRDEQAQFLESLKLKVRSLTHELSPAEMRDPTLAAASVRAMEEYYAALIGIRELEQVLAQA